MTGRGASSLLPPGAGPERHGQPCPPILPPTHSLGKREGLPVSAHVLVRRLCLASRLATPHTLGTGQLLWLLIAVAAKPVLKDDPEQHLVGAEGTVTTIACHFLLLKTPDHLRTRFSPRAHQQQAWDVRHVFPKTCFHFETIFKKEKQGSPPTVRKLF